MNYFKLENIDHRKLTILALTIVLSYLIFRTPIFIDSLSNLGKLSYLGIFFAGILFSFGFTVPFAIGLFLTIPVDNILLAATIGGLGSVISDLFILIVIQRLFKKEIKQFRKTKLMRKWEKIINNQKGFILKNYLPYAFTAVIIASPIPDEIGISLLAGITDLKKSIFSLVSFALHATAILIILYFKTQLF